MTSFNAKVGFIQLFQAYPADVSQQVRPAAGIDKFLVELFVGNLLLAVPVLTVRETPVSL